MSIGRVGGNGRPAARGRTRGRTIRAAFLARHHVRLVAKGCLLGTLAVALSSCAMLPPNGATAKGRLVGNLYVLIGIPAGIVFVAVLGILLLELYLFRKRDDRPAPQDHGRPLIVGGFFAIGLVIIAIVYPFGEVALQKVDKVDPHPGIDVMVTGSQWQWSAMYEQQGFSVSGQSERKPLVWELPVNTPVRIDLRSTDIMHEFYVPDFLYMRNAIPGHPNVFTFTPDRLGAFSGECAQLCGVYHYQMTFTLKVVTRPQFQAWVSRMKSAGTGNCPPPAANVMLTAYKVLWNTKCIAVPAGKPVTITMKNEDSGIKHNFAVYNAQNLKTSYFRGPIFAGPGTRVLHVPALRAGTYYFRCDVHGAAMSGTYVVRGS